MGMKALITGITGFAGGFLAEHLLASGDEVFGASAGGAWPEWASDELRRRVPLVVWDVGRAGGLSDRARHAMESFAPDCIYHLAAVSVPGECLDQPQRAAAVNVEGAARAIGLAGILPGRPRVLFTSTSHVYAPVSGERFIVDETWPLRPRPGYGQTKLAAEQRILEAARRHGLQVVVARAFQHTGPRQRPPMMLPEWTVQLARGVRQLRVRTREAWIDLTDVRDVVRAYRLLIERGEPGGIYNVGSGSERRSGDVLDLLLHQAGVELPVVEDPGGFKREPIAHIGRLVSCTGWQPLLPLEQTIADTLDYWFVPRHAA